MKMIEWNDSFSVGDTLMDAHHQVFFQMIEEFRNTPDKGDRVVMKRYVDFLVEYTAMHLSAEEALMQEAGYPELDRHKSLHDAFARKVVAVADSLGDKQSPITGDEVLAIVQDWLVKHIMDEDKRYTPYIQKLRS